MKLVLNFILVFFILSVTSFTYKRLPKANQEVVKYIETVIGTQVGTGECSDLVYNAQYFLKHQGISSKSKSKKVLPGDFVSFKNAMFKAPNGPKLIFMEHYAVVYKVISQKEIIIVHQNHNGVKIVQKLSLKLNELVSGTYLITHPIGF